MAMEEPRRSTSDGRLAARRAAPKGERRPDPRQWERPQRKRRRANPRGARHAGARKRARVPRQAIVAGWAGRGEPARRSLAFARERLAEQSAAARQRGAAANPPDSDTIKYGTARQSHRHFACPLALPHSCRFALLPSCPLAYLLVRVPLPSGVARRPGASLASHHARRSAAGVVPASVQRHEQPARCRRARCLARRGSVAQREEDRRLRL